MPRILDNTQLDQKKPCSSTPDTIKNINSDTTDIKLALLETKLVPRDLINNFETTAITESTYLFVDNNGVSGKILALDILPKEITWDSLEADIKQKLLTGLAKQDKLVAGDHILITKDNKISVSMTAADLGAITNDDAVAFITEQVALKIAPIREEVAAKIMVEVAKNLSSFREEINETLYKSKQEIIQLTDSRIDARLANIEEIINTNIEETVANLDIDCGVIKTA